MILTLIYATHVDILNLDYYILNVLLPLSLK